jgi:hypothetical protein
VVRGDNKTMTHAQQAGSGGRLQAAHRTLDTALAGTSLNATRGTPAFGRVARGSGGVGVQTRCVLVACCVLASNTPKVCECTFAPHAGEVATSTLVGWWVRPARSPFR